MDRLSIMLELDKRGKLPQDKKLILDELRRRGSITSAEPKQDSTEGMSGYEKFMSGVGGSMYMTGKGLQQKAAQLGEKMGLVSPETVKTITQEGEAARADLKRLKQDSTTAKVGSFVGDVVPGMAIPGGVVGGLGRRVLTGMAAGALQGGAQFTGEGESTTGNILRGGAFGAAAPVAFGFAAKPINAITGKLNKPINVAGKVPTTLGEDLGNAHLQKMETLMERIPVIGLSGFRKKQYEAANKAAKDYLGSFVAEGAEGSRGMLEANRAAVGKLYNVVRSKVADFDNLKAYANTTADAANDITNRYPAFWEKFGDAKVSKIISNFKEGAGKQHSFDDLWELRKSVGDMLGQAKQKMMSGDVSKEQYSMLSKVYSSINDDMDRFASSVGRPDISTALKTANDAYKQNVVKYNIIERAYDKAAGAIEDTGKKFSPQRFHTELNKMLNKEKYNNLFTRAEKSEMAGIANIMTTVKRAGQYMENPPTGNRLIDMALGGGSIAGLMTDPLTTAKVAGGVVGTTSVMRFLTTTQAGKRLAMAASTIEPDSKSMKLIMDAVQKGARSYAIQSGGNNNE